MKFFQSANRNEITISSNLHLDCAMFDFLRKSKEKQTKLQQFNVQHVNTNLLGNQMTLPLSWLHFKFTHCTVADPEFPGITQTPKGGSRELIISTNFAKMMLENEKLGSPMPMLNILPQRCIFVCSTAFQSANPALCVVLLLLLLQPLTTDST